ncbi:hypothetical protein [Piscinibacter sakaiensis]|uniref:Uncharacterized protein n=1 Tax=Piscinibacter sakaiensis TaxID=1547922 RepID=A0A0K8P173_PISS1|nr:hypothetical protein [Piscinibacter sakaiensis]GAP36412.1 hypothetical protein ISF6_2252 [Piscinibacter sakaiensis]
MSGRTGAAPAAAVALPAGGRAPAGVGRASLACRLLHRDGIRGGRPPRRPCAAHAAHAAHAA